MSLSPTDLKRTTLIALISAGAMSYVLHLSLGSDNSGLFWIVVSIIVVLSFLSTVALIIYRTKVIIFTTSVNSFLNKHRLLLPAITILILVSLVVLK